MNVDKLMKMAGSVPEPVGMVPGEDLKKKAIHKATTIDDKRLKRTLKRIGVNAIPAMEEIGANCCLLCYLVEASIAANTWVVSGIPQNKKLLDILPQIIHQLGPDNLENLKKLAEQFQKQAPGAGATLEQKEDEDEVHDLVDDETFEAAIEDGHKS